MHDVDSVREAKLAAVEEAEDRRSFLASMLIKVLARLEEPGRVRDAEYRADVLLERALFREYAGWTEAAFLLRSRL